MLYGTKFLPDYPPGLLKLGRFRGITITGYLLDNKQDYMRDQVLSPLLETGLLEMTIPAKRRSPQQRYRTTAKGRQVLGEQARSAGPHVSDEIR